jgi:hypothetical protein
LAEDGTQWVLTHPRVLFPVRALSTVCRAKFLAAVQQAYAKEALRFAQEAAWCGGLTGFTHLLDQLYGQPWVVYAKRPCAGPTQVLEYLGRAISTGWRLPITASWKCAMAVCASRIAIGAKASACKP